MSKKKTPSEQRKSTQDWIIKNTYERKATIDGLKSKPCLDCGNVFPPCAMDFDHVRGEKKFNISKSGLWKWKYVLEEIEKCDLVCSNCHRIRTLKRLKEK